MDRYKILFDESRDAISLVEEDGTLVDVNQAFLDLFGLNRKDIPGLNVTRLYVNPVDRNAFRQRLLQKGFLRDYELKLRRKDGTPMICLATSSFKAIRNGDPVTYLSIIRDVTERRRAEESLVQRQAALQAVYELMTSFGTSFETLCGQVATNLSRLLKASHVAVLRLDDADTRLLAVSADGELTADVTLSEQSSSLDSAFLSSDAQLRSAEARVPLVERTFRTSYGVKNFLGVPIRNSLRKAVGLIVVMDRSERIFTDLDLHLAEIFGGYIGHEIERRNMERQLRRDHRMKMLGQIAAGVAHEVRNPLGALLAITEALYQDLGEDAEHRAYLDHIKTQVNRLSGLMLDLLNLGKPIESSSLQPEPAAEICASAIDLWKQSAMARARPVTFVRPPHCDDVKVLADGAKLQQVLFNLLTNAGEASPPGSEIVIALLKPEKEVRISVADKGSGISSQNLRRVFEPFFTTKKGGVGLGLSIVKNIIEAHGGKVVVQNNEPPPGCTVEIILPALAGDRP